MKAAALAVHDHGTNYDDAEYAAWMRRINTRLQALARQGAEPLFTTDIPGEDLWGAYLASFPTVAARQYHNCNACRHFIERFGGLVAIWGDGSTTPVAWDAGDAPLEYRHAVEALAKLVRRAKVTGVFLSKEPTLGAPEAGGWLHFGVTNPRVFQHAVLTAGQAMAEKREDFKNICVALAEFTPQVLDTALQILETDSVYRAEAVIGPARFLRQIHTDRDGAAASRRNNIVWRAIATAPAGFLHPRSSMVGTLLEDLAAGKSFEQVAAAFKAKMHPLRYQRPQAAPAAGNIAQAEKLFAQMGLAPALERRIARVEEIPLLWQPQAAKPAQPAGGGVFGHLTPKGSAPAAPDLKIPAVTMTLEKFVRTVIPGAEAIEVRLSYGNHPFIAITTAVNPEAPKLFQWDHPFAWYVWHGGAPARQYGLQEGWNKVSGITRLPARWNDENTGKFEHQGDGIILLVEGARETRSASAALFPSLLRSELHGVRSTIEAHSNSAQMQGLLTGDAIGLDLRKGQSTGYPAEVRVTAGGRQQTYKIDRWD